MPLNVQTFEIMKRAGLDLLKDHRDDFPPQYLRWLDVGYQMSALDFSRIRRSAPRSTMRSRAC
jgi:amidase/aspartyl-tRNA(Asn)/glutamyl-tRNA(Gln) amidotransferase subunit A